MLFISGKNQYQVPRCIGVSNYNISDGNYVTYKTGTEASSSFQTDVSMSARYLAVSAGASTSYGLDKSFKREDQFAFYSFNADTFLASMRNYADLLNETALLRRLKEIPEPFDGQNDEILDEWKDFFASFGSHVILNARHVSMIMSSELIFIAAPASAMEPDSNSCVIAMNICI